MRELMRAALRHLPEQERQIVSLFYISDHPQNAIAAFLGVSVDTVKNRLRTARRRLKERLLKVVEENLRQSRPSKDGHFAAAVRQIIAPDPDRDTQAICDLLADKIQRPDMAAAARNGRIVGSHYDWSASRIAFAGDELAAHIGIYRIDLRLGAALLRVGGINVDYVDPNCEAGDALFAQAVEATLDGLYARGYDMVLVRDNGDQYAPHGFVPVMPFSRVYRVKTSELPTAAPTVQIREIPIDDLHSHPGVAQLYNAENSQISMTAVRPTYPHSKNPSDGDQYGPVPLLEDAGGRLVGYFSDPIAWEAENQVEIEVTDSAGDPEERLRVLAQFARRHPHCQGVAFFNLPYGSPMAHRLRALDHTYAAKNERTGGHIPGRLINLPSTLEKMTGEFSRRLEAAGPRDWTGTLQIGAAGQTACLAIDRGAVAVAPAADSAHRIEGDQEIAQLIFGTKAAGEVIARAGIHTSGDAAALAEALFPAQHPILPNEYL